MGSNKIIFVEGENEKNFVKSLKKLCSFEVGKIYVKNILTNNSKDFEAVIQSKRRKSKNIIVMIVVDYDVLNRDDKWGIVNEKVLSIVNLDGVKEVHLYLQENLESELCKVLEISERGLKDKFSVTSLSEYKAIFNKIHQDSLLKKLGVRSGMEFWLLEDEFTKKELRCLNHKHIKLCSFKIKRIIN